MFFLAVLSATASTLWRLGADEPLADDETASDIVSRRVSRAGDKTISFKNARQVRVFPTIVNESLTVGSVLYVTLPFGLM